MVETDCGAVDDHAKGADFVAQDHGDWWTIQTLCGPTPRAYAINKASGEVFELPDDRCPFVVFTPAFPR